VALDQRLEGQLGTSLDLLNQSPIGDHPQSGRRNDTWEDGRGVTKHCRGASRTAPGESTYEKVGSRTVAASHRLCDPRFMENMSGRARTIGAYVRKRPTAGSGTVKALMEAHGWRQTKSTVPLAPLSKSRASNSG
jgi:hypothetical protein